ncbi:MAG: NAD(P)/FAD-dependent oxidoreductase [Candidatus Krumholzibacteria bacterium]|nr:NAD(P)/FAD-dependent oxidoreductase [Candidatus Krumholzibacteria bacterium]
MTPGRAHVPAAQVSSAGVVIVGGGFAGLYAARELGRAGVPVTLVDRRNFHLFQPLLYQVATGGLSPGDISAPLRAVVRRHRRTRVLQGEAVDVLPDARRIVLRDGELVYDRLIVATGVRHHYFGNDDWERYAPGLKTIEDALEMRRRLLSAFEQAEKETDGGRRAALLTFVVVGGGPTGVELAGALAELARQTLRRDFRRIDPRATRILLLEGADRVLPPYPASLSRRAHRSLDHIGVTVRLGAMVTRIGADEVVVRDGSGEETIRAATILWAAGVQGSPLGEILARRAGAELDGAGRVRVTPQLTLPGRPEIYVVGDLAVVVGADGKPVPGVAPAAVQQGRYVARRILGRVRGEAPFRYRDKGNLAVIGRNAAVYDRGRVRLWGFPAWFLWVFLHIWYLIEFDNKILVMVQWAFDYCTRKRGARLITNEPDEAREGAE